MRIWATVTLGAGCEMSQFLTVCVRFPVLTDGARQGAGGAGPVSAALGCDWTLLDTVARRALPGTLDLHGGSTGRGTVWKISTTNPVRPHGG
jgi:hypothetical protein